MATYRVVLSDSNEFEVEADGAIEEDGAVRFWASEGMSRRTVASFAKGQWRRYFQPTKAKEVAEEKGPFIA